RRRGPARRVGDARAAEPRRRLPAAHGPEPRRGPGRRPVRRRGPRGCRGRGGGRMTAVVHTGLLTARALRQGARIPVFMVMNLVQPMIWLLLFGQLFRSVVEIPGFSTGGTYLEFITPGVVMMTAMFGAA